MRAYDREDDLPLDAAQERLRRKLVRLLVVSGGIMALGLIAVFAAIVYRVSERSAAASGSFAALPADAAIAVPPGYRLAGAALAEDRALLTLEGEDGAMLLLLVELGTGEVVGRYRLAPE